MIGQSLPAFRIVCGLLLAEILVVTAAANGADEPARLAPGSPLPLLQIREEGPLTGVFSLAFSPDGSTLYAGGQDKVVHIWRDSGNRFEPQADRAFRIPIGPGADGAIETIAISQDGRWLAVAGRGAKRDLATERDVSAFVTPAASMTREMWLDEGLIYVFDTRTRRTKLLRGHAGSVSALQFVQQPLDEPALLISAADVPRGSIDQLELALWDVEREKQLASMHRFPYRGQSGDEWNALDLRDPAQNNRIPPPPTLAAWKVGSGQKAVQVALVYWHSKCGLRIWTPETGQVTYQDALTSKMPSVGCMDPRNPQILWTADYNWNNASGAIESWDLKTMKPSGVRLGVPASQVPTALCVFQGDRSYAACITIDLSKGTYPPYQHELRLFDIQQRREVRSRPLWNMGRAISTVVASSKNKLATARSDLAGVNTFDLNLEPRNLDGALLRGRGRPFGSIRFVRRNGTEFGLALRSHAAPGLVQRFESLEPDELVLNTARPGVLGNSTGWSLETPPKNPVSVSFVERSPAVIASVREEGQPSRNIAMQCDYLGKNPTHVTAFVVCSKSETIPVPLLIAALECDRRPFLHVYNLQTGDRIREFAGHRSRIGGLAVSADGRYLASTSTDCTVRLWSLGDWDYLGRRGMIRQGELPLAIESTPSGVRVIAPFGGMPPDTLIIAAQADGRDLPIDSAGDLYSAINKLSPGSSMTLSTKGGEVPVTVGQAIDRRNPVASIYFYTGERLNEVDWVGWHPTGPFECSRRSAEERLGWHFHTGNPQAPVRFADAREYRDKYYTPGLLKQLLDTGRVPKPLPPAPPSVSLLFDEGEGKSLEPDQRGEFRLGRLDQLKGVQVAIGGPRAAHVQTVKWSLSAGNGPSQAGEGQPAGPTDWTFDVSRITWSRGLYKLRVQVVTDDQPAQQVIEERTIRFQPLRPEFRFPKPVPERVQQQSNVFPVEVLVNEPTIVSVKVRNDAGELISKYNEQFSKSGRFSPMLRLDSGFNRIEWTAIPQAALKDYEDEETANASRHVEYQLKPAPLLAAIEQIKDGSRTISLATEPRPIKVRHSAIEVSGFVRSNDSLATAEASLDGGLPHSLDGFRPGNKKLAISQRIPLGKESKPQTLLFHFTTERGAATDERLVLQYQPPLPQIAWDHSPAAIVECEGNASPAQVTIAANFQFDNQDSIEAFQVTAEVDGKEQIALSRSFAKPRLHEHCHIPISLSSAAHSLRLVVTNRWGVAKTAKRTIAYLQPPTHLMLEVPKQVRGSMLEKVAASVESAIGRPTVILSVNGDDCSRLATVKQDQRKRWRILIENLALRAGKNEIVLAARNADGQCQPLARTVTALDRPPLRQIEILSPAPDQMLPTNVLENVTFHVRSEKKLTEVTVLVNGKSYEVPAGQLSRGEIRIRPKATLAYGRGNTLAIRIRDEAGPWPEQIQTLSCPPPPVVIRLRSLNIPGGEEIPLSEDAVGATARPCPAALAILKGSVEFSHPLGRAEKKAGLQLWVNGFMQEIAALGRGGDRVRTFEAPIILNRRKNNVVEVRCLELKVDDAFARSSFSIDCLKPNEDQRLDLMVVAPPASGLSPAAFDGLKSRILAAIGAIPVPEEGAYTSKKTAFNRIYVWPHQQKQAGSGAIQTRLQRIRAKSRYLRVNLQKGGPAPLPVNEVLLIYYIGKERVLRESDGRERFVLPYQGFSQPDTEDITSDDLSGYIAQLNGAHLLFLDVQAENEATANRWPRYEHLGILRTVLKGQDVAGGPVLLAAFENAQKEPARVPLLRDLEMRIQTALGLPPLKGLLVGEPDAQLPPALAELQFGR